VTKLKNKTSNGKTREMTRWRCCKSSWQKLRAMAWACGENG